jgi:hypothetical protein
MIQIPFSPRRDQNLHRHGHKEHCFVCGKELKAGQRKQYLHVFYGSHAVTEEEAVALNDPAGDCYFFPIGTECLRRHPELKAYAQRR